MTLDAVTGALHVSPECALGPHTTLDAFKQDTMADAAEVLVDNPPYLTVGVNVDAPAAGRAWNLMLCFEHDRIAMIVMSDITGDTEDNPCDEAWERKRRARHGRWLRKQLGAERTFSWGTAGSFYDDREIEASIVLNYGILTHRFKAVKVDG